MIVEACDICKKLNTERTLLYFYKQYAYSASMADPAGQGSRTDKLTGFGVSKAKGNESEVYCSHCLRLEIQKATETLSVNV